MRVAAPLILCLALLSACGDETSLCAGELPELLRIRPDMLLLDVRTPEEFARGHYPGAINLPVDDLEFRFAELPPNRPVLVYCAAGRRAARAQTILWRSRPDLEVLRLAGKPDFSSTTLP